MNVVLNRAEAAATGMTLAYHAQQRPAQTAVVSSFGERTFMALNGKANQLARVLRNAGLKPDDGVAMLLANRPEFLEVYYACQRAGFRITPINWHLTGDNASYVVGNCEARAFIADVKCSAEARRALQDNQSLAVSLSVGGYVEGFDDYQEVLGKESPADIENPEIGTHMLYTSGTTGRPKGVYRERVAPTSNQTVTRAQSLAAFNPDTDCTLCTGPAYHAAPLAFNILAPIANGVGVVMMDKWDAEETLQLIETHKVTHTHMVATMFHRLLALPEDIRKKYDLGSMRYTIHGAAPCPVHVKQAMMEWFGPVIYEYYAATEGGGGFFVDPHDWLTKPGTVGKAPVDADNKICDEQGKEVAQGTVGTIYFKAPKVRFKYFKDDKKTSDSYMGDYFTLGDMGYFDPDGYLFLTGRSAETIISGGVNIYPQETDDVLLKHPAIADVCTVGIPNDEGGEEVKSVVQLAAGVEAGDKLADDLILFVRQTLPAFKAPKSIDFVDDLPRLPSGKIQRRVVRAPYWAGRDKQI